MICLIALVIFAVLGIFSAKYRGLSKEAFNCVFRRITLRKCETGFDKKMKAGIVSRLMNKSPAAARLMHRHFEAISWLFTITLLVSMYYSGLGLYNYAVYNNCNGQQGDFCIFNAVSGQSEGFALSDIPLNEFPSLGPKDAPVQIVEFGCFQCPYTKAAKPELKKILEKYTGKVRFTFMYAPIPHHVNAIHAAEAAARAAEHGKFMEYHDALFQQQEEISKLTPDEALIVFQNIAEDVGLNATEFETCITSGSAFGKIQQSIDYANKLGISQTPTFYLNGKKLYGQITEADVKKVLGG
ncbi:MAG: thioredoxin domain-containing protein [Nanoarchaeota archaeon]|nr:DsbA family protein [Nanoarchaeota archaeon]MBU4299849.1 DsbA family protein [Nanoarchaeota archaeon]MBU4451680.1 DsbA family protein [Nanoarchaeota archaeon]MCG2723615.1 DsbA family protein [archaeon]